MNSDWRGAASAATDIAFVVAISAGAALAVLCFKDYF